MIAVENLTKRFGPVMAIDRVTFEVEKGEVVGFLGQNGAGKTTTMRILTSYMPATSGIAKVAGFDVMLEADDVRRNIGYLPESVPLYPEMRVEEYIAFRAKLKGLPRKERIRRVEYCLERCRLMTVRRRLLNTLSKGYRQRVGLADAMVHNPPILILDEPTSGLDPTQIRETLLLLKELGENHTILLSTHILGEVEQICERIIIIKNGRVSLNQRLENIPSTIKIEARGPRDAIAKAIMGVNGVTNVQANTLPDGFGIFDVRTQDNSDLREEISKTLTTNHWTLRRLEQSRRLEEAFFEVISMNEPLVPKGPKTAIKSANPPADAASEPATTEAITKKT